MGTDAWLEIQEKEEIKSLVARNYHKTYFSCFIDNETFKKIKSYEECRIIVITSNKEFPAKDLTENLNADSTVADVEEWIENKINSENMDLEGLIFCYYTKQARKKYHGNHYID